MKNIKSFIVRALLTALAVCLFATAGFASIVYVTQENYQYNKIGYVLGSEAPTAGVVENLGGDSGAQAITFDYNGTPMVAVTQYVYAATGDTVWVYDATDMSDSNTWTTPTEFTTAANVHGSCATGNYLYFIGYDNGEIYRHDMSNNYESISIIYDGDDGDNAKTWTGEAIVAYGDKIYAIFSCYAGSWSEGYTYYPAVLVVYDKDLKKETEITLNGCNVDGASKGSVVLSGSKLYISSIGGAQSYVGGANTGSMIEVVDLSAATPTSTVLVSNSTLMADTSLDVDSSTTDFRGIALVGDDVYINKVGWGLTSNICYIYKTSLSALESGDYSGITLLKSFEWSNAWPSLGVAYDSETGYLWVSAAEGDANYLGMFYKYDLSAGTWTTYDNTALGGSIASFEVLTSADSSSGSDTGTDTGSGSDSGSSTSSGGGCNAGFGALALLLAAPVVLKKRKD